MFIEDAFFSTANLAKLTKENDSFRKVVHRDEYMELTLYRLRRGEAIPEEIHDASQFIRVEEGTLEVLVDGVLRVIEDDGAVVIPPRKPHTLKNNCGNRCVRFYAIYSPPQHHEGHEEVFNPDGRHC